MITSYEASMRTQADARERTATHLRFTSVWEWKTIGFVSFLVAGRVELCIGMGFCREMDGESQNCWFLNGFVCSGGARVGWKSQNCWFLNGLVWSGGMDVGKVLVFEWFWASQGYAGAGGR